MALGAIKERVQLDVLRKTIGIAAGTIALLLVPQWIASLLFGTRPTDPMIFGCMVLLLGGVAFVVGYIPVRRASRIDPMIALRSE